MNYGLSLTQWYY